MSEIATTGLDPASNALRVGGADTSGRAVRRKKLRRNQLLVLFGQSQGCVVTMEASNGVHFWGREIGGMGQGAWLPPLTYLMPFVKCQKDDAADAEKICEAAQRLSMRFLSVKCAETQGAASVFHAEELLI